MRETSWLGFILYVIINIASCREKLEEYEAAQAAARKQAVADAAARFAALLAEDDVRGDEGCA